jgi:prepilin-type N-terminal cleavage/methylation domain-containing protein/MYXO-CTERM domain-containing protein
LLGVISVEPSKPLSSLHFLGLAVAAAIGGHRRRRAGRTLIELLVVIAIIALMVGLFLTGVHYIWEAVNRFK